MTTKPLVDLMRLALLVPNPFPAELNEQFLLVHEGVLRDAVAKIAAAGHRVASVYDTGGSEEQKKEAIREYHCWLFRKFGLEWFNPGFWSACERYAGEPASPERLERLLGEVAGSWFETLVRGAFIQGLAVLAAPIMAAELVYHLGLKTAWYAQFTDFEDAGLGAALGQAQREIQLWRGALDVQITGAGNASATTGSSAGFVGLLDAAYAWLESPGLILYRRGRRRRSRQRVSVAALRALETEEEDLAGRLKSNLRFIEVAEYTAIAAILISMVLGSQGTASPAAGAGEGVAAGGAAEGAATAAEGAATGEAAAARQVANATETVAEQATRYRPPQWDYGSRTGASAQDLAKLAAVVGPGLPARPGQASQVTEGVPSLKPPADEGAFVNELAWELLLRLPCGTAAAEAREQLARGAGRVDLAHVALVSQQESMASLLLSLSAQVGGVSRLVELLDPDARRTPATPRDLAEIVARKRDVVLSLDTWNAMLTLPDEWIGKLSDQEQGSQPPP